MGQPNKLPHLLNQSMFKVIWLWLNYCKISLMYETFIDLDELIVLCRDKSAKKFIQEAVDCYRAGAYRSCIVSTWNAVVFDFIHKKQTLQDYLKIEVAALTLQWHL